MNEHTQQLINQILERAISGVDAAVAFGQEQIPQVVVELLWWHGARSVLGCLAALAILGLTTWIWWRLAPRILAEWRKPSFQQNEGLAFALPLGGAFVTTLIVMAAVAMASLDWLQILVAPRLYLIEYAAELAK